MPPAESSDRLQGTLDLLILRTLVRGPMHGWSVALAIQEVSHDVLRIKQGSLYPALHRLERAGIIASSWGVSDTKRRAKFYFLTALGQQQLDAELSSWKTFAHAVARVIDFV